MNHLESSGKHMIIRVVLCIAVILFANSLCHAESLYQEDQFRPLTSDNKAFRVGDILTVQVIENSSATTSADTGTHRKNDLSSQLTHPSSGIGLQASLGVSGDFDGGGQTQRSNRLLTTLTVSVRRILSNGDLEVAGEQVLTVNDEPQKVKLEGHVRPQDISDSNVVLSTRLADAKISYIGEGDLAERSKRAWWRNLMDTLGF